MGPCLTTVACRGAPRASLCSERGGLRGSVSPLVGEAELSRGFLTLTGLWHKGLHAPGCTRPRPWSLCFLLLGQRCPGNIELGKTLRPPFTLTDQLGLLFHCLLKRIYRNCPCRYALFHTPTKSADVPLHVGSRLLLSPPMSLDCQRNQQGASKLLLKATLKSSLTFQANAVPFPNKRIHQAKGSSRPCVTPTFPAATGLAGPAWRLLLTLPASSASPGTLAQAAF